VPLLLLLLLLLLLMMMMIMMMMMMRRRRRRSNRGYLRAWANKAGSLQSKPSTDVSRAEPPRFTRPLMTWE
jgi:hypothetical protein